MFGHTANLISASDSNRRLTQKNGSGLEIPNRSRFAGLDRPLKEQFQAQLYRAIPAGPQDRIAGRLVGRSATATKVTR
jgi:hypothetical protein